MAWGLVPRGAGAQGVLPLNGPELLSVLIGLSVVYDPPLEAGFVARVFLVRGPGECGEDKDCVKDRLFVVTALRDEYPEAKGYDIPIVDEYVRLEARHTPDRETGYYEFVLQSLQRSGSPSCSVIRATASTLSTAVSRCDGSTSPEQKR